MVLWVLLALGIFARVAEKVIDRGEKIELLVDKAEELNEQAARFKKQSNTVRTISVFSRREYRLCARARCG